MWKILILSSLLTGCSLTPQYCRSLGVDVVDGAGMTGRVIAEHEGECAGRAGCAKMVRLDEWEVWYTDYWVRQHEHCHALYQTLRHTDGLDGRQD